MENNKSTFGRSVSMPIFQNQQQDEPNAQNNGVAVHFDQYDALQHSPGFQTFRNQANSVWSRNGNGFANPLSKIHETRNDIGAANDVGMSVDAPGAWDTGMGGTSSNTTDFSTSSSSSIKSEATIRAQTADDLIKNELTLGFNDNQINADTATSDAEPKSAKYAFMSPSDGAFMKSGPNEHLSCSSIEDFGVIGEGRALNNSSEVSLGSKTPQKNWLPGLQHRSPDTDKTSPPKDSGIYVPGGFGNHRKMTSQTMPSVPSPLGPQALHNLSAALATLMSPDSPMQSSPHRNGQYGRKAKRSQEKIDLHVLKVSANAVGSPYHRKTPASGLGHARNITDPFVENNSMGGSSPGTSPFGTHAREDMPLPSTPTVQVPATPPFEVRGSPSAQRNQNRNGSSNYLGFNSPLARRDFHAPKAPVFQPTPSLPADLPFANGTATRVDLPIPPPPLSTVHGKLQHTQETRDRLNEQAIIRAEWIRTEAAKIAQLSRQMYAAEQQFRSTGSKEDYEVWQRLAAEYAEATDLDKRQEERRNMFMPPGMTAMRTGVENPGGDQSAAFGQSEREGKLLGFKQAYMERICAEMQIRMNEKAEEDGEEITKEMLAMLKKDEKKVLRQYLADRLKNTAERRD
ncbi:hypothetical protein HBH69_070900 [Parastagonospora nodorum]|nr:hypothetical protein HBH69_070900 [Parastagonospora nodorum]